MPRSKEYDRDQVLQKAMVLFWDRGYHATGVADLEAAMGINKFSLYAAFGNKRGLLLEALDLYARTWQSAAFAMLDPAHPARSIEHLFAFASDLPRHVGHNGCLLLSIGQELNHADPDVMTRIDALYRDLELRFQACLERLGPRAPLSRTDPATGAVFLRTLLEGLLSRSRHSAPATHADPLAYVRTLLGLPATPVLPPTSKEKRSAATKVGKTKAR